MTKKDLIKNQIIISGKKLMKRYNVNRQELFKLISENKLKLLGVSNLYFKTKAVHKHFKGTTNDAAPIVINSRDLMARFSLNRIEFIDLLKCGHISPISIEDEQNLYFGYKAVCKFFASRK